MKRGVCFEACREVPVISEEGGGRGGGGGGGGGIGHFWGKSPSGGNIAASGSI